MAEETLRDLRRKHNEERNDEMASLYSLMRALAQRDCFPTTQLRKHMDPHNRVSAYEFDFANPWYVGEPVSTIQDITVIIDGHCIGQEHITFVLRGQKIPVKVAKTMHEVWWGFGEVAQILIEDPELNNASLPKKAKLEVHFDMRTTMYYGVPNNLAQYVLSAEMEL